MNVDPSQNPDREPSGLGPRSQPPFSPHQEVVPLIPWQSRHAGRINLPPQFPEAVTPPKYNLGTHCCWTSQTYCDRGTVIGQVYAPDGREAPIQWSWVYLILLHSGSASEGWIVADWVDEADLEPLHPPGSS